MNGLRMYAGYEPMLLVYVVGIALAVVYWRRCPRAAAMVLIACAAMLLTTMAFSVFRVLLARIQGVSGMRSDMYVAVSFGVGVIRAGGWAVVLAAVFTGRREAHEAAFVDVPTAR